MLIITASKTQAVAKLRGWAEDAESVNQHGLCGALSALAGQVDGYDPAPSDLSFLVWTVKSVEEFPDYRNVECIMVFA